MPRSPSTIGLGTAVFGAGCAELDPAVAGDASTVRAEPAGAAMGGIPVAGMVADCGGVTGRINLLGRLGYSRGVGANGTGCYRGNGIAGAGYDRRPRHRSEAQTVQVGVRALKNGLSAYLDLVKGGLEIVVTEHGRPVARLGPVAAQVDRMAALVEAGIVQPPRSAGRHLPAERVTLVGRSSLDEDVAEQRI